MMFLILLELKKDQEDGHLTINSREKKLFNNKVLFMEMTFWEQ